MVNSNISKVVYVPSYHLINDFLPKKGATGKAVFFAFSDPATIKSKKRTRMIELPGTYREVVKLKNQYPDSRLYSGNNATKNNFLKEYQNPDNHYIHLALHGVAVSDTKDDIKLYFRTKPGGLDSLYGYELLNLNSSCKKIVLSACHSGAGKYIKGEGLFSLPRYFMINGANDVSFNFWEVED